MRLPWRMPPWWSWVGIGEHLAIGTAVAQLSAWAHADGWLAVLLMLGLGLWHEWSDGDFTRAAGAPWNGIWDVLAFLLVPLLGWVR